MLLVCSPSQYHHHQQYQHLHHHHHHHHHRHLHQHQHQQYVHVSMVFFSSILKAGGSADKRPVLNYIPHLFLHSFSPLLHNYCIAFTFASIFTLFAHLVHQLNAVGFVHYLIQTLTYTYIHFLQTLCKHIVIIALCNLQVGHS